VLSSDKERAFLISSGFSGAKAMEKGIIVVFLAAAVAIFFAVIRKGGT